MMGSGQAQAAVRVRLCVRAKLKTHRGERSSLDAEVGHLLMLLAGRLKNTEACHMFTK